MRCAGRASTGDNHHLQPGNHNHDREPGTGICGPHQHQHDVRDPGAGLYGACYHQHDVCDPGAGLSGSSLCHAYHDHDGGSLAVANLSSR